MDDPRSADTRAVFLDRDGVLNDLVWRDGAAVSPRRLAEFRLRPGAPALVSRIRRRGLRAFVVSNQPDIARGLVTRSEIDEMNLVLRREVTLDDLLICPHDDADGCECRKPRPGMLTTLADRWQVVLQQSFVVGDTWKDIEAGRRAGCRTILVRSEASGDVEADVVVPDLAGAVAAIEEDLG